MKSRLWKRAMMLLAAAAMAGCGGDGAPTGAGDVGNVGTVRLDLIAMTAAHTYRLGQAVFTIDSSPTTVLHSDPPPVPDTAVLTASLAPGNYTVTLDNGWALYRQDPGGPTQVSATVQASSVAFTITAGLTTSVPFRFSTDGTTAVTGTTGSVAITPVIAETASTTWDPSWSGPGVTFTGGNLSISGNSPGTKNVRTTVGKSTGRYYWEITATAGDGITNAGGLGIIEAATPNNTSWIGSQPSGLSFGYGSCCYSIYWFTWPGVSVLPASPPANSAVKAGIVYMLALDLDAGRFWAGQNGSWYNGGDPATGINPAAMGISGTVHPGVTMYDSSINAFTANFGASAFVYPVPAGFKPGFY